MGYIGEPMPLVEPMLLEFVQMGLHRFDQDNKKAALQSEIDSALSLNQ
jgi:hypothetical protein